MSERIKNLKNQIEKNAAFPVPNDGPVAHSGIPSTTAPSGNVVNRVPGNYVAKGSPEIREMQLSMKDLADAVMQDAASSTMALKNRDVIHQDADQHVQQAKKSFNDFIAEQYIGGLSDENKGVEWDKNPDVITHPAKKQTQTDIYELDTVMNTLSRVGSEKGEFKADGNWDWRTQNALKNMLGFAYALLQLEGDFGLNNKTYNIADWNSFKNILGNHSDKLNIDQKKAKANIITRHLKNITRLYNNFRQQVIARPEFRPFLEGKRSFDKYNNSGSNKDVLTPQEQQLAASDATKIEGINYIAPGLPNKQLNYIPLKALSSKEEYLKWMLDYAGVKTEDVAWKIFNNVIKPKIEAL